MLQVTAATALLVMNLQAGGAALRLSSGSAERGCGPAVLHCCLPVAWWRRRPRYRLMPLARVITLGP